MRLFEQREIKKDEKTLNRIVQLKIKESNSEYRFNRQPNIEPFDIRLSSGSNS
jgi:hypothetical protein